MGLMVRYGISKMLIFNLFTKKSKNKNLKLEIWATGNPDSPDYIIFAGLMRDLSHKGRRDY